MKALQRLKQHLMPRRSKLTIPCVPDPSIPLDAALLQIIEDGVIEVGETL